MKPLQILRQFRDSRVEAGLLRPGVIADEALMHQAKQVQELVDRLKGQEVVLLRDRTGAGKTVVSIIAAGLAARCRGLHQITFVAPNREVQEAWEQTYGEVWGTVKGEGSFSASFTTHKKLIKPDSSLKPDLLVIDEAHRGLQSPGAQHHALAKLAANACVLLVSATPFQLSTDGLIRMLSLPGEPEEEFSGAKSIRRYGHQVHKLLHTWRQAKKDLTDSRVRVAAEDAREASIGANKRLDEVSPMPMGDVTAPRPPSRLAVPVSDDWLRAYHAARVVPELLEDVHSGDMFRRRLLSSSEAFWAGEAGRALMQEARHSQSARAFEVALRQRLGRGEGHAKVAASVAWIADQVAANQHVLVFCVFRETQDAIANTLKARGIEHINPADRASLNKNDVGRARFQSPPSKENPPLVLVARDNLSESIDLDGGHPSLLHHDLAWNPARLTQRWGRLVRRSSSFEPVPGDRHKCPVVPVEFDERMATVVLQRQGQAKVMVPGEALQADDADEQVPWLELLAEAPQMGEGPA